ncbi:Nn.00g093910.m01.CDS01 [Neocucurbitaria sp. VM-36]
MGKFAGGSWYAYSPSVAAAVVAIVVFTALFFYHTYRLFRTRTWFCSAFVVGAIFEIVGYAGRLYGHYSPSSKPVYIVQTLGILLAPILFAASVYMFLGRIIRATGYPRLSLVRPSWLTKIFVGGDIFCFLIQAIGATMLVTATEKKKMDRGKTIVLVGLVLQIIIFGFFVVVALMFHLRLRKIVAAGKQVMCQLDWAKYLHWLYIVSVIITLRNIYRVVEYEQGVTGYLMTHEWSIYVFDALLMALVLLLTSTWYLGHIETLPEAHSEGLGLVRPNTNVPAYSYA